MTGFAFGHDAVVLTTGIAAALCLTAAPLFRSRQNILLAQVAAGLCFAAHYWSLGLAVAAVVNILSVVQTGAALRSTESAGMQRLGYALIFLMALVGLWFWQGPVSGLSVVAMSLIALARMQSRDLNLRVLLLAGGCFWLLHDLVGQAWIALAADVGAIVVGAVALFALLVRVSVTWRPAQAAGSGI